MRENCTSGSVRGAPGNGRSYHERFFNNPNSGYNKGQKSVNEVKFMATAKDTIKQILESQPDDSSYDELLRELAFKHMIDRGLADAKKGEVISNEEMGKRIESWQK